MEMINIFCKACFSYVSCKQSSLFFTEVSCAETVLFKMLVIKCKLDHPQFNTEL